MEKKLSVVVSVYNEEQALPMFYETTKLILEILPWDYELLFVNDGSRDDSLSHPAESMQPGMRKSSSYPSPATLAMRQR